MDRFDFFFRQKVTESELDGAFAAVEDAMFNWALDNGIVGITTGGVVTENAGTPNMTVDVSGPATIYDQLGERISWSAGQDIDCSVDENSNSTAVTTPGNTKWLTIFAQFDRSLSDPRLDGEGTSVYFNRAESFAIHVAQGAEAVSPTKPSLRSDEIVLADILLDYGMTQILNADIDDSRREWAIKTSGATNAVEVGTVEEAIQALADYIDDANDDLTTHIAAASNQHLASAVDYAGGSAWHDATTNPAATVEAQLDKIITELADETTYGNGGADKVGASGQGSGVAQVTDGSIYDQIGELIAAIEQQAGQALKQAAMNWTEVDGAFSSGFWVEGFAAKADDDKFVIVCSHATSDPEVREGSTPQTLGSVYGAGTTCDAVHDVAWGSKTEDLFIMCGLTDSSSGAMVETSPDGITWTTRTPTGMTTAGDEARAVIWNGTAWIVVGTPGKIIRSTNSGVTWAAATSVPTATDLVSLATNDDGSVLIAVGRNGTNGVIFRSTDDGDNWTQVFGPFASTTTGFKGVAWDSSAQRFMAVGSNGYVVLSDDATGSAWTSLGDLFDGSDAVGLAADGQATWLASTMTATGKFYVSRDLGSTWEIFDVGGPTGAITYGQADGLRFAQGRFCIGASTTTDDVFYISQVVSGRTQT